MLIGTAFVAVSCLALRGASAWWVSTALSMAVVGLVVGLLLAIYRTQGERAFWTGFCFAGAAYLGLVLYVWHLAASENIRSSHPLRGDRRLPTGSLSEWTYEWLYERPPAPSEPAMYGSGMGDMYSSGYASSGSYGESGYGADYGSGYGGEMGSGMPGAMTSGYGSGAMPGSSGMPGMAMSGGYPGQPAASPPWKPDEKDFVNVAHSLWAIVLATAGGWIALVIYTTGQRREAVRQASSLS